MNHQNDPGLISLRDQLEWIERKMDVAPAARRLPVWARAALLGAGLTLAAGCADPPAKSTSPSQEPSRVEADATEAPGMSPPPAPMAEPEDKMVVRVAGGVYGAPPARQAAISMIKVKRGTIVSKKPGSKPTEIVAFVSVKYDWTMPRAITAPAKSLYESLRGSIDACLVTAMQKDDLKATGFAATLKFEGDQLQGMTLRDDQALPAELRACVQAAADALRPGQPASPANPDGFSGTLSFDVSW